MELRQYLSVIKKWFWLIALVAIIGGAASYYTTSQMPQIYQASARVMVGESFQKVNPTIGDINTGSYLAETYVQLVQTSVVLRGVIEQLGLSLSVDSLRGRVSASAVERTQFIDVRATDTDPKRAAAIANAVAEQLILLGPATSNEDLAARRDFISNQITELESKIEKSEAEITQLEDQVKATTSVREATEKRAEIDRLRSQIAQYQQNYTQFINFLNPASQNRISLLEPAEVPARPFSPNLVLNVALAVIIGIILATAVAFLIEYFDDTLKTNDDIARVLNASTLGEIGSLKNKGDKLIAAAEPRSQNAEAYRMLRTNISFSSVDKPIRIILTTSASPGEGKSVTAANLAVTMAQAGYRTVVLDCDLRKPTQHKIFNVSNDVGLTNSLLAHSNLQNFLRPTRVENLRILTSGPLPPNPAELLGSRSMTELLEIIARDSDMIVLDSPPMLAVTDAAVLARISDGVLLIVDSGKTKRESGLRAKEALEATGARLLGVVINRMPARGGYYSYNSKYYSSSNENSQGRSTAVTTSSS